MINKKFLLFIIILVFRIETFSIQITQKLDPDTLNTILDSKKDSLFSNKKREAYFPSLFQNIKLQAISPFNLDKKQIINTSIGIGITTLLIKNDGEIDDFARTLKAKSKIVNFTSPKITELGGNYGLYALGAFGLGSVLFKNEYGKQSTILASQAFITSSIWIRITKILSGRERPSATYTNSKLEGGAWYGPFAQLDQDLAIRKPASSFDAFASGHTATAFSIATVIATRYKNIKVVPIITYTLASLVGISRLTEHEHWASDVFVGAVFGYLCGKQVVKNYNNTQTNTNSLQKNVKQKPKLVFTQKGNQLGLAYNW